MNRSDFGRARYKRRLFMVSQIQTQMNRVELYASTVKTRYGLATSRIVSLRQVDSFR